MLKRIFCLLTAVVISVGCLTSCSGSLGSINDLLRAPKYSGELYDIQQALYSYAGRSVTLRYPHTGDNRTAFIRYDFDSDSVEEAVAFYSSANAEGVAEVHINIIDLQDGQWRSVCDTTTGASDIHRVDISPLAKGGAPVIAVGSELYSTTGNQLSLFTYSDGRLHLRMQTNYTKFMLCDLKGEGYNQLLVLDLNAAERLAKAYVYTVDGSSATLLGSTSLDGNISTFGTVGEGRLSDGRTAVFIDSVKSTSTAITDAVFFEGETLINPFFDKALGETQSTLRSSSATCMDVNGDGVTDIPFTELLPGYELRPADQRKHLTVWRSFDGKELSDTLVGDFGYDGGYYFAFPKGWRGRVTLICDDQNNMRSYRVWDAVLGTASLELLRIRQYTVEDFDKLDSSELVVLSRNDTHVWAARITLEKGDLAIDSKTLLDCFNLL